MKMRHTCPTAAIALLAAGALAALRAPASEQAPQEPVTTVVTYASPGGQDLSAHIFRGAQSASSKVPAVILFHGGAWEIGRPEWVAWNAQQFAKNGFVAVAVQYRLFDSKDSSRRITIVDAVNDACTAFGWVRARAQEWNIDAKRIVGFGVSAGGHLAAMAGTGACGEGGQADALLLISPAVDPRHQSYYPRKMPLGVNAALLDEYSPIDRVRVGARVAPTIIVNGARDIQTPADSAREFCKEVSARKQTCQAVILPELGHLLTADLAAQQRGEYPPNFPATARAQEIFMKFLRELGF